LGTGGHLPFLLSSPSFLFKDPKNFGDSISERATSALLFVFLHVNENHWGVIWLASLFSPLFPPLFSGERDRDKFIRYSLQEYPLLEMVFLFFFFFFFSSFFHDRYFDRQDNMTAAIRDPFEADPPPPFLLFFLFPLPPFSSQGQGEWEEELFFKFLVLAYDYRFLAPLPSSSFFSPLPNWGNLLGAHGRFSLHKGQERLFFPSSRLFAFPL